MIHDFGSVLCVYECVFLLILGMHKGNYIGISSRLVVLGLTAL